MDRAPLRVAGRMLLLAGAYLSCCAQRFPRPPGTEPWGGDILTGAIIAALALLFAYLVIRWWTKPAGRQLAGILLLLKNGPKYEERVKQYDNFTDLSLPESRVDYVQRLLDHLQDEDILEMWSAVTPQSAAPKEMLLKAEHVVKSIDHHAAEIRRHVIPRETAGLKVIRKTTGRKANPYCVLSIVASVPPAIPQVNKKGVRQLLKIIGTGVSLDHTGVYCLPWPDVYGELSEEEARDWFERCKARMKELLFFHPET